VGEKVCWTIAKRSYRSTDKKPCDNKSGDMGAPLEGLKKIYYNPKAFKVLPYRHNYTQTGEYELTGFFIPYFVQALDP
jgi:hypothetical protein